MKTKNNDIHKAEKRLEKIIKNSNLDKKTQKSYLNYNKKLIHFIKKSPRNINSYDIILFLENLVQKGMSRSTLNTVHSALKYYYQDILHRKFFAPYGKIARAELKKPKITPLNEKEIEKIIKNTENEKYKIFFLIMIETGIKADILRQIKKKDIKIKEKTIKIKNKILKIKDQNIEKITKKLLNDTKDNDFLFKNKQNKPLSMRIIQKNLKKSTEKSHINKKITCQTLRDNFILKLFKKELDEEEILKKSGFKYKSSLKKYKNYNVSRETL